MDELMVPDLPRVGMRGLPRGTTAHRATDGQIVLWNGTHQAWIGPNGEGKRHGLFTLRCIREFAKGKTSAQVYGYSEPGRP